MTIEELRKIYPEVNEEIAALHARIEELNYENACLKRKLDQTKEVASRAQKACSHKNYTCILDSYYSRSDWCTMRCNDCGATWQERE